MTETKLTMQDKKLEAKRLYIIKDLTAKAVGKVVDVSEKTMSAWVKKYKWREEKERLINMQLDKEKSDSTMRISMVHDFKDYLKETYPHLSNEIDKAVKNYLKKNTI